MSGAIHESGCTRFQPTNRWVTETTEISRIKMSDLTDLYQLIEQEIPDGRQHLQDSHANLERVAAYCEGNYLQVFTCHIGLRSFSCSMRYQVKSAPRENGSYS